MRESKATSQRLADLERAQGELRRRLGDLAETVRVKDNSVSYLTNWLDREVCVTIDDKKRIGVLRWFDKFNIGVEFPDSPDVTLVSKGRVDMVSLTGKEE